MEYFDALERLFGVNDAIREHIQKAKTNSEQCQTLVILCSPLCQSR